MKKIYIKIILILTLSVLMLVNISYGGTIDTDIEIGTTSAISSSNDMISRLVGYFQVIGSVISVIALVIIGIRYMLSSVDEKAQIKGVIWYYLIGAILVFGTSNVLSIVYNVISKI